MFATCVSAALDDTKPILKVAFEPATNRATHTEIKIDGPIVRRHSFFSEFMGCCSMDQVAEEMMRAEKRGLPVLQRIGSPGGEAIGMHETADVIAQLQVPVYSYNASQALSAGFLIHSQGHHKYSHPAALVGSVGVRASKVEETEDGPSITLSENASKKDDVDVQSLANSIEREMLIQVARGFGVDRQYVIENFGQGDVFTARDKPEMGGQILTNARNIVFTSTPDTEPQAAAEIEMNINAEQQAKLDAVGGIDKALELAAQAKASETQNDENNGTESTATTTEKTPETETDLPKTQAELDARIAAGSVAAVKAENARQRQIKALPGAAKLPKLAARLIDNGISVEEAKGFFADHTDVETAEGETSLDAQHAHDQMLDALEEGADGTAAGGGNPDPMAEAKRIAELTKSMKAGGATLKAVGGTGVQS